MKKNLIFLKKVKFLVGINFFKKIFFKKILPKFFLKRSLKKYSFKKEVLKYFSPKFFKKRNKFLKLKNRGFHYLNKFVFSFLEFFFKMSIIFNIKKGSNKIPIKSISSRNFFQKFFKKNLKIGKQIIGLLYYAMLLKDANILIIFLRRIFEKNKIKSHKKILYGLKKIIKTLFKPIFFFLGLKGVYLNIKGKLGVSGNAKKRRYFFYFGEHSISKKSLKMSYKFTNIWTYTGTLGLGFFLFF